NRGSRRRRRLSALRHVAQRDRRGASRRRRLSHRRHEESGRAGYRTVARARLTPLLYYIRHGETDWNVEARLQGGRDIPINANGRAQAHRCGEILAELLARDARDRKSTRL